MDGIPPGGIRPFVPAGEAREIEADARRIMERWQLIRRRQELQRRIVHQFVAFRQFNDLRVHDRLFKRPHRAHRVEMVAPCAFIPWTVVRDAFLNLREEAFRAENRAIHQIALPQRQAGETIGGIMPAADVVDAPLVLFNMVCARQQHLLRNERDVFGGQLLLHAVDALYERDAPRRFVQRLRRHMAAAARRFAMNVMQRIVQITLRIAHEDLTGLRGIPRVFRQLIDEAQVACRERQFMMVAIQHDVVVRPA